MNSAVIERNGTRLELHNCDCLPFMRGLPDKAFDLAIVDPPYGMEDVSGTDFSTVDHDGIRKVNAAEMPDEYWIGLRRVSKTIIAFGANYYTVPFEWERCVIVWDKQRCTTNWPDGELAYTTIKGPLRIFKHRWDGYMKASESGIKRIHPTQKPVALYSWLLANYAKPGQAILDTHLGSGSIAIACLNHGHNLTACELDPDYFKAAVARIEREASQAVLPIPTRTEKQPEALLL